MICSVDHCLSKFLKTWAFLCFQSVPINKTNVSKPLLASLRSLFLASVHHLSKFVFSCGSCSYDPSFLKQSNQTILAYRHCERIWSTLSSS
jgi:hypothetical protein